MTGVLLAAAGLLVIAGAAKVWHPADTGRALGVGPAVVRAGAALEVVVGTAALFTTWAALLVGASYAGFAVFVFVALRRGWSLSTCGCFGEPDTPPSGGHVAVDLVLAAGATTAALTERTAPAQMIAHHPAWGATVVVLAAVTGGLAYLLMASWPRLRTGA